MSMSVEMQGPTFLIEPAHRIDFSNGTGGRIDCSAHGSPPPTIDWLTGDGSVVSDVAGLRESERNGSLIFPPFPAEHYRHDIHNTIYRCRASNTMGQVITRDVHLRAGWYIYF
ncbi:hypothetical protein AAG570_008218 [Ranatra chinensis]|uniref:Ig-like domain-containing protein n=1 Tax=Ranatra chinensis TaxID=642074 RepID=A0ABD0XSI4_9HEMI